MDGGRAHNCKNNKAEWNGMMMYYKGREREGDWMKGGKGCRDSGEMVIKVEVEQRVQNGGG